MTFDDWCDEPPVAPFLTVYVEDPEIVATLLDHRGQVLFEITDRPTIPVGFAIPGAPHR